MVALRTAAAAAGVATAFATGGASVGTAVAAIAAAGLTAYGISEISGLSTSSVPSVASVPSSTGLDRNPTARAGVTNNITVKAVDSEGAARAVAKVLTKSSARSIPALDGASIRRFQ